MAASNEPVVSVDPAALSFTLILTVFAVASCHAITQYHDLPAYQRLGLLLPTDSYKLGQEINRGLENLKYKALDLWEKTLYPIDALSRTDAREECTKHVLALRTQIDALRATLERAYEKTYQ